MDLTSYMPSDNFRPNSIQVGRGGFFIPIEGGNLPKVGSCLQLILEIENVKTVLKTHVRWARTGSLLLPNGVGVEIAYAEKIVVDTIDKICRARNIVAFIPDANTKPSQLVSAA
jgi:hypothetical protein